jgi:hypothetical protein
MDHRFLMAHSGGRWQQAGYLRIGQTIAFAAIPWNDVVDQIAYAKGYLRGMTEGDGTARWAPLEGATKDPNDSRRQVWWRVALKDRDGLERILSCLDILSIENHGIKPFYEGTEKHAKIERVEIRSQIILNQLREAIAVELDSDDYRKGFLAGAFDAEGSVSVVLRIAQININNFLDTVERYLSHFGFRYVRESHGTRLLGGMWEVTRFNGLCVTAINRKRVPWDRLGTNHSYARIILLEELGERDLVDIQTTSRTFYANGFATHNCYQGSTRAGKHASLEAVVSYIQELAKLDVFEIAYGGGEPTLHPNFKDIILETKQAGITPNFTTKNVKWLQQSWASDVMETIGGILLLSPFP